MCSIRGGYVCCSLVVVSSDLTNFVIRVLVIARETPTRQDSATDTTVISPQLSLSVPLLAYLMIQPDVTAEAGTGDNEANRVR